MCLGTRQDVRREMGIDRIDSDQSGEISIQLESLILAQNERWRQA
jgi:hypothetical protein